MKQILLSNLFRFRFYKTKGRKKDIKKRHELMHVIYDKSKHRRTY